MAPAQPDPEIDSEALKRAGHRVTQFRVAHTVRKNGRRYPMTQEELAKRARVSPGCLAAFENGARRTTLAKIKRIAAACGMTLDALIAPGGDASILPTPDQVLTDEALAIARMFMIAHTEVRMRVIVVLRDHLIQRKDPVAISAWTIVREAGTMPPLGPNVTIEPISSSRATADLIWRESVARQFAEFAARAPGVAREMLELLRSSLASGEEATGKNPTTTTTPRQSKGV